MKNLVLIAIATALSLQANAQKIELGANVGGNFSCSPPVNNFSPDISIKAAYNINKHLQAGISSSVHSQAYEITYDMSWWENYPRFRYTPGSVAVNSIKAFVNAKQQVGKTILYAGLSGGYVMALHRREYYINERPGNGYTVGAQAGATFYVTKKLGINAELGANYINMWGDGDFSRNEAHTHLSAFNFPATVGIRYNIGCSHGCCPFSRPAKTITGDKE